MKSLAIAVLVFLLFQSSILASSIIYENDQVFEGSVTFKKGLILETPAIKNYALELSEQEVFLKSTSEIFSFQGDTQDNSFTFVGWLQLANTNEVTLFQATNHLDQSAYSLRVLSDGALEFQLNTLSGPNIVARSLEGACIPREWSFLTISYDGLRNTGSIVISLNAVNLSLKTDIHDNVKGEISSDIVFEIRGNSQNIFQLDHLSLFDKVLSEDEISKLFNNGYGVNFHNLTGSESFLSNISAWYDFNDLSNLGLDSMGLNSFASSTKSDSYVSGFILNNVSQISLSLTEVLKWRAAFFKSNINPYEGEPLKNGTLHTSAWTIEPQGGISMGIFTD